MLLEVALGPVEAMLHSSWIAIVNGRLCIDNAVHQEIRLAELTKRKQAILAYDFSIEAVGKRRSEKMNYLLVVLTARSFKPFHYFYCG